MNIRRAALNFLARREHSRGELAEKLSRKFPPDSVRTELDELVKNGLLSDLRFAREYVRSVGAKFGREMLRQKLQMRGVSEDDISAVLSDICEDESVRAAAALAAKYGGAVLAEEKSQARACRFLCSRGFAEDDSLRALALHNQKNAAI